MLFGLFDKKTRKPISGKAKNVENTTAKNVFQPNSKNQEPKKVELKIFKPRTDFNLNQNLKPNKTGLKINLFSPNPIEFKLNYPELKKKINYIIFKYNIGSKINWLIGRIVLGSIFVVLLYLTFFDTYFLVKNYSFAFQEQSYQIQTENGPKAINSKSYLSEVELKDVTTAINNNRFFGIVPNNQYWYLNKRNLLASSQEVVPEITDLTITDRQWPNGVGLKLTVEPILATLSLNENGFRKYYRISQLGRVITEDLDGLKEKLITVDNRISFNQSNVSFKDYPLKENKLQLNRIWFTITIWQLVDLYGLKAVSTTFPSMTDTEVGIITENGTKLLFESDTELIPKEAQENRIKAILASNILADEKQGKIAYIDFRIQNKKVFICYKGKACNK